MQSAPSVLQTQKPEAKAFTARFHRVVGRRLNAVLWRGTEVAAVGATDAEGGVTSCRVGATYCDFN